MKEVIGVAERRCDVLAEMDLAVTMNEKKGYSSHSDAHHWPK